MKKLKMFVTGTVMIFAGFSYGQLSTDFAIVNPNAFPGANNVGIGNSNPQYKLDLFCAPGLPGVNFQADNFHFGQGNVVMNSQYSGAHGLSNNINNGSHRSFTFGTDNMINQNSVSSFAAGFEHLIDNNCHGVAAIGGRCRILDATTESAAIGEDNEIRNGHGSISLGGHNVNNGAYTITIGSNLNNPMSNTLMAGFGGFSSLFIDGGSGNVGIGNNLAPAQALDVTGTIRSSALAGGGNVVANASGDLVIGPVVGDNLGNHIATMDLDMTCNNVINVADITFCNGPILDQTTVPGELILQGAPLGIGVSPSSVGFSPLGTPAMLAVAGEIWAGGFWYASDKRFKENITALPSALETIQKLNGYSYEYMTDEFPEFNFHEGETFGFLAQEMLETVPELVQQGENGYYSVNYLGVIPVLTEAIKEQQTQIEEKDQRITDLQNQLTAFETTLNEMREEVNNICKNGCDDQVNNNNGSSSSTDGNLARLDANVPNPFNGYTSIGYFVPGTATSAYISINDLNGRFIMKHDISDFGFESKIEIESGNNGLTEGIYLYSLVIDNQIIDSKKMIVTE